MEHTEPLGHLALARGTLDRCAHERARPGLVQELLTDPGTRVLDLVGGQAPIGHQALSWRAPGPAEDVSQDEADGLVWVFLGRRATGEPARLARLAPADEPADPPPGAAGLRWGALRECAEHLDDDDAAAFTTALALSNWHAAHRFCPRCGVPTRPSQAGWVRVCQADGSEHYPRTDPAVIVAVVDAQDRLLLGHNRIWPEGRFSTLAGFVEPGEPLEAAVRREVAEESGVIVAEVTFLASQPWPFPSSLMLGCLARATDPRICVDGEEVTQARWFSRQELADEVSAGTLVPPGGVSIARRLVEYWFGGPLPSSPQTW
ncbi:MAG: NAD(+) diphosphatase [Actinomycetales bacterium]